MPRDLVYTITRVRQRDDWREFEPWERWNPRTREVLGLHFATATEAVQRVYTMARESEQQHDPYDLTRMARNADQQDADPTPNHSDCTRIGPYLYTILAHNREDV